MDIASFPQLLYFLLFVLGAITGSYLKAWTWRVERGLWRFPSRSLCESCWHQLKWYDNIPMVSFLVLRGSCRYCDKKIGWDTFLTEIVTGFLFVFVAFFHEQKPVFVHWQYFRDLFFVIVLIVTFIYDAKYMMVLSGLTWSAAIIGFGINYFVLGLPMESLVLGMVIGGGFFGLQYAVSKGVWVGGGDVRLGVMIGAWLGWPMTVVALLLSYVIGSVISVPMLVWGDKKMKSQIPFGTFLAIGTFVAIFFGEALLKWYLSFIT